MRVLKAAPLTAILLTAAFGASAAEVYEWVDENGVVNYSQRPPVDRAITAKRIDPHAARLTSAREREDAPESSDESAPRESLTPGQKNMLDDLKQTEAERQAEIAGIRADNCSRAREVLTKLTTFGRIRIEEPDGTTRVMPEEERQSRIEEAQLGVARNCDA